MKDKSSHKKEYNPANTRLQVTRRLSFSTVPDVIFRLNHLRFETRLTLAWALGRPSDWSFSVGHLCHELGLTDYRWRAVRAELIRDGWLIHHRENEPTTRDTNGEALAGAFRWTMTFTDAPLVEAVYEQVCSPEHTPAINPTSRSLNTTDAMPDPAGATEHWEDSHYNASAPRDSHYNASEPAAGGDEPVERDDRGSHGSATGSCNEAKNAHNGAMQESSHNSATSIRRKSTHGGTAPSVDFRSMGNSTDGTPYISNQDDDDDDDDGQFPDRSNADQFPDQSNVIATHSTDPIAESKSAGPAEQTSMPVGDITDRIAGEGFRMAQVVSTRFLKIVRGWQLQGITPHELERSIALAHTSLAEGTRPGSPMYYDWAVGKIIGEREASNESTVAEPAAAGAQATSGRAESRSAPSTAASAGRTANHQQRKKGFDNATAQPKPVDETRYGGIRPESYRQRRTEAQKQRERDSFGFCVEDFE